MKTTYPLPFLGNQYLFLVFRSDEIIKTVRCCDSKTILVEYREDILFSLKEMGKISNRENREREIDDLAQRFFNRQNAASN